MPVEADEALVARLTAELERRGIRMLFAATRDQAREAVLGMIPPGATVMAGSSMTLQEIGLTDRVLGGDYRSLREGVRAINDPELRVEKRRQSLTADYFLGGVNAIATTGEIVNIEKENTSGRITVVLVGESLGF